MKRAEESSELLHGSNSSLNNKQGAQKSWIEGVFRKRECVCFVPGHKEKGRCGCGRLLLKHFYLDQQRTRDLAEDGGKWAVNRHTELFPTDAFGTIEFQGGPHPTKAQFVRLAYDTQPELILQLLQNQWKLELPKLLISVHGGIANFTLQPKLKRVFRKGLLRAAKTTGAWIITGGTDSGVMRHVGDALGDTSVQARNSIVTIGMAPWGIVHHRQDLVGQDVTVPYHAISSPKSNNVALNSNHSYFLLVDNGTVGKYGGEIILRKKLEKFISQQKLTTRSGTKSYRTPVVCLVLEGGTNTIRTVLECVTDNPPVPIVVCDGSGRAADLLAFTLKYAQDDGTMPESLRDQLILTIEKTFQYSREQAEKLFIELMLCVKKKDLITVFRMGEGNQDIDLAILTALLKGQNSSAPDQLSLALAWNRVDIARSHIFVYGQEWPDGSLDQAMMDALVNDRVDFVKLLIENGVSMKKFLTIPRLEELYNIKQEPSSFLKMLVQDRKKNFPPGYRYTLYDIGQVIEHLMGGAYRSSYCRRKFRSIYNTIMRKGHHISNIVAELPLPIDVVNQDVFEYPFHDLMVWAILLKRQKMAKFMWQHGEEPLAKALIATKLYKSMGHEAAQDDLEIDVSEELKRHAVEFSNLAIELLDHCYRTDDDLAEQLLTYELANWSKQTCLSLAVAAVHREFLAHTCCQMLLTDLWMGGLRMRKYTTLKVILGIMLPPTILMLEFKSKTELEMMPQTLEEHIQELEDCDSEESFTDAEDEHGGGTDKNPTIIEDSTMCSGMNGQIVMLDAGPSMKKMDKSLPLGKKFYEFYNAPVTRFWAHTLGYITFLMLFTYIVLVRMKEEPSWQECYVIAYIFTMMLEKVREIMASEPNKMSQKLWVHFTEMWNIWDGLAILVFMPGLVIRFLPGLLQHGRVFYCVNIIFWYVRILDIMSVNKYLGPYVMMIGKMVKDMVYFIVILLIVMMSFGIARQAIRNPHEEPHWQLVRNIYMEPYFMIYGEVYAGDIDPECGGPGGPDCVPGRWVVPAIMAIYLIVANILLINLLIAVFNNTFHRVNSMSTQVWKFLRYSLVIEFEDKPILPPPAIIVCHLYLIVKYIYRRCQKRKHIFDNGLKLFLEEAEVEKLHDFEEECVEDYFRKKDQEFQSSTDERVRVTTERVENMALRMDDMNQKENAIKLSLQTVDYRLAKLEEVTLATAETLNNIQQTLLQQPLQQQPRVAVSSAGTSITPTIPQYDSADSGDQVPPVVRTRRDSKRQRMNEKRLWPFTDYSQASLRRRPFMRAITVAAPGSLGHEMATVLAQHGPISSFMPQDIPYVQTAAPGTVTSPPKKTSATLGSALYHRRRARALSKLRGQAVAGDSSGDDEVQKGKMGTPRGITRVTFADSARPLGNLVEVSQPTHTGEVEVGSSPAVYTTAIKDSDQVTTLGTRSATAPTDTVQQSRYGIFPPTVLPETPRSYATVPVTPIITPSRSEYTTITDEIDTTCITYHQSPPGSPTTPKLLHFPVNLDLYTKKALPNTSALRTESEQLKSAEESEHEQMEKLIRRRMRQISLTETDSLGDIAKHVVHELEMEEQEEQEEPGYHSDNGDYDHVDKLQLPTPLTKVQSEPWLSAGRSESDAESVSSNMEVPPMERRPKHRRITRQRNNSESAVTPTSPQETFFSKLSGSASNAETKC